MCITIEMPDAQKLGLIFAPGIFFLISLEIFHEPQKNLLQPYQKFYHFLKF
jgi:hypothetical protein